MLNVLLIDDSPSDVLLVRTALRQSPIPADVVVASDGEQALKLLEKTGFDLVLLDLNLPRLDGHTILKQIRLQNGPPVVVFSGSANPEDRQMALELGAVDYVVKPSHLDDFYSAVLGILERWSGNLPSAD
jgi:DNA-binding response OmpR family regulator